MKKLNKLQLNSERLIKNEQLITIRGGYDTGCPGIACSSDSDCCPLNPKCEWAEGGPYETKFCFN